jgi:hypothetical protein
MPDKEANDLASMSVSRILGSLTPSQLFKVGAVSVTMLSGAFAFGAWLGTTLEQPKQATLELALAQAQDGLTRAQADIQELQGRATTSQIKERVLGFLVMYHDSREKARREDASEEQRRTHQEFARNLFEYVMGHVRKSESGEAVFRVALIKGIDPALTFVNDPKSTWPLPCEIFCTAD